MITPRFSLSQDDTFLTINIRAPYCNLKDLELYVEENDFRFICTPYYLRLNLPGNIVDNDSATGQFLTESGEFILKYPKQVKDTHFDGLDFITSLLAPAKGQTKPLAQIEVLSETDNAEFNADEEGNEWHIEQKLPEENIPVLNVYKYGFANQKCDVLLNTEEEYYTVFEIRNVDKMSIMDRKHLRYDTESMNFSSDHYLADLFDDSPIKEIIKRDSPWKKLNKNNICFDNSEKDVLKDLPNKEYLLNEEELKRVLYGLIDILYAYCYDKRTTEFENNCESGWTITKISATLSWFDEFHNEKEVVTSSFRRSLIYPLYRNFEMCLTVLEDLKTLLSLGEVFIVKSLIEIFNMFNKSAEPRYILNELYIKDYLIFMQKCPKVKLEEIINNINKVDISKNDVNLNLDQIVAAAVQGCVKGQDILEKMAKLNISNVESDSESESDSDSSEDSSSDSDDSSSSSEYTDAT